MSLSEAFMICAEEIIVHQHGRPAALQMVSFVSHPYDQNNIYDIYL